MRITVVVKLNTLVVTLLKQAGTDIIDRFHPDDIQKGSTTHGVDGENKSNTVKYFAMDD